MANECIVVLPSKEEQYQEWMQQLRSAKDRFVELGQEIEDHKDAVHDKTKVIREMERRHEYLGMSIEEAEKALENVKETLDASTSKIS